MDDNSQCPPGDDFPPVNFGECPAGDYRYAGMLQNVTFDSITGMVFDGVTKKQIGRGVYRNGILHVVRELTPQCN